MPEYDPSDDIYPPTPAFVDEGLQFYGDYQLSPGMVDSGIYPLLPHEIEALDVVPVSLYGSSDNEPLPRRAPIPHILGAEFLHSRDRQLHTSLGVEAVVGYMRAWHAHIPNEPVDKISAYMDLLTDAEYVCDGILNGNSASIHRQVAARVMAAEDIPDAYFDLQQRINRHHEGGDAELTNTREHISKTVQADQYSSAMRWAKHLGASGEYPGWFNAYVWDSVGKMGRHDKQTGEFTVRSRGTTAPYPELSQKALAYVYKALDEERIQQGCVEGSADLHRLLEVGNFNKLYAYALREVVADEALMRQNTNGAWRLFCESSDDRVPTTLADSLQGHGSGWCVVNEGKAEGYLERGNLHVYYSNDREGNPTIPRAAIQMKASHVSEVRGIGASQEMEAEILDILRKRLVGIPGGEMYVRKIDDRVQLATIDKRITADPAVPLPPEDVRFLYEIDRAIEGFGIERDPHIAELRRMRGQLDRPEIARIMPEAVRQQLDKAYDGYKIFMDELNQGASKGMLARHFDSIGVPAFARSLLDASPVVRQGTAKRLFDHTQALWRMNGTYNYLVDRTMEGGGGFTLVATPNIVMGMRQIVGGVKNIGTHAQLQAIETGDGIVNVSPELFDGKSVAEAHRVSLQRDNDSNALGVGPLRFSLISTVEDTEFSYEAPAEIQRRLAERQARYAGVGIRIPDFLDAASYWLGLRVRGEDLDAEDMEEVTRLTHIGLYEHPRQGTEMTEIAISGINDGIPFFEYLPHKGSLFVRLAIG
jgi:hypothetical protein